MRERQTDGFPQQGLEEIRELLADISASVQQARQEGNAEFLTWADDIAGHWQHVMTSIFGIPIDVRETLGILPVDIELRSIAGRQIHVADYLNDQAYRIGAVRKLLVLLRQLQFYSARPDRIHTGIPSTQEECEADWRQACTYLALEVLSGRIPLRNVAADGDALAHLDTVFLEDLVRLGAYLSWEQSHCGTVPDRSQSFYYAAEQSILARLAPAHCCDPVLVARVADWFKIRLVDDSEAVETRRRRQERKTLRLIQECGQTRPDAERIACDQLNLFEHHIIPAIVERCPLAIEAVIESVTGTDQPLYRRCATALEGIVVSHCVVKTP